MYDSLYNCLTTSTELQIASIVNTSQPKISVEFVDIEKQFGSSDCGVYALAYTTALSLGQNPGTLYSLPSIRDEETSFQNIEGKETYYVSSVKEKAECESDRGQSHPSILYLQDAGPKWEI